MKMTLIRKESSKTMQECFSLWQNSSVWDLKVHQMTLVIVVVTVKSTKRLHVEIGKRQGKWHCVCACVILCVLDISFLHFLHGHPCKEKLQETTLLSFSTTSNSLREVWFMRQEKREQRTRSSALDNYKKCHWKPRFQECKHFHCVGQEHTRDIALESCMLRHRAWVLYVSWLLRCPTEYFKCIYITTGGCYITICTVLESRLKDKCLMWTETKQQTAVGPILMI